MEETVKKYLSSTQLNMFLRCPRQYEFRYIQGLKIPPSGAMIQGRAWHEALEANYSQKIKSDTDLPLDDMQGIFAERFDESIEQEEFVSFPVSARKQLDLEGTCDIMCNVRRFGPLKVEKERLQPWSHVYQASRSSASTRTRSRLRLTRAMEACPAL